jgi:hypothetical protein
MMKRERTNEKIHGLLQKEENQTQLLLDEGLQRVSLMGHRTSRIPSVERKPNNTNKHTQGEIR